MRSLFLVVAIMAAFLGTEARASPEIGGTIADISVGQTGNIHVKINATPTGRPACATNSYWTYEFKNADSSGSLYAQLLTAYYQGRILYFAGMGACTIDGTIEDLGYARI